MSNDLCHFHVLIECCSHYCSRWMSNKEREQAFARQKKIKMQLNQHCKTLEETKLALLLCFLKFPYNYIKSLDLVAARFVSGRQGSLPILALNSGSLKDTAKLLSQHDYDGLP